MVKNFVFLARYPVFFVAVARRAADYHCFFINQYMAALGIILLSIVYFDGRKRYIRRQKAFDGILGVSDKKNVDQASCYALQHFAGSNGDY